MELAQFLYLVAALLFVFGIKLLAKVRTARRGNLVAAAGMLLAVLVTVLAPGAGIELSWPLLAAGLAVGAMAGAVLARRVAMTAMPEMVALLNGFGGAASLLVALASFWGDYVFRVSQSEAFPALAELPPADTGELLSLLGGPTWSVAILLSVLIGTVTFTGSLVAMGKLSGKISGNPILLPGRHFLLLSGFLLTIALGLWAGFGLTGYGALTALLACTVLAGVIGVLAVIPIGGADMPVVVSLLNSYSGLAAAMAGFVILNPLLITAGALVGASGLILTNLMCKAMNRSLLNVLLGGFGGDQATGGGGSDEYENVKSASPEEAAMILEDAESVVFVPGYGMAVAQAQHIVKELAEELERRGAQVRFAIHPVAGRMPGHMNVLLAEADVPYDKLWELERINNDFRNTDVAVVVGANDVVNPAAIEDPSSPIYGMPILNVHEARTVLVVKRSLSPGYAGIKNPLFERDNALMCFGDGKAFLEDVLAELRESA